MSRDSNPTHLHLHASHHADLFEEFCRPPSSSHPSNTLSPPNNNPNSTANNTATNNNPNNPNGDNTAHQHVPGSFLPYEEIYLPQHLMPINPEDEDDVVPDMHAAFGINRALGQGGVVVGSEGNGAGQGESSNAGVMREAVWRDLGMEELLGGNGGGREGFEGERRMGGSAEFRASGVMDERSGGRRGITGARREGRRTGVLLLR